MLNKIVSFFLSFAIIHAITYETHPTLNHFPLSQPSKISPTLIEILSEEEINSSASIPNSTTSFLETPESNEPESDIVSSTPMSNSTTSFLETPKSNEPESDIVSSTSSVLPQEIDLGEYQTKMNVGEKQLLIVTVLPINAVDYEVKYETSDSTIASINGMGRITALKTGQVMISVSADAIIETFLLEVLSKNESNSEISVIDVEVSGYKEVMDIGEVLYLDTNIIPLGATDATINYSSNNANIVSVSSTGTVKAVSKGKATIFISAGGITKTIEIEVIIPSERLQINKTYIILQPLEIFKLQVSVQPVDATQDIVYKSTNGKVATVSAKGIIKAIGVGNTTIIVTNGELSKSVTVIVNNSTMVGDSDLTNQGTTNYEDSTDLHTENLLNILNTSKSETITISSSEYPVLNSKVLNKLCEQKQNLTIEGEGYFFRLDWEKIANPENFFYTELDFSEEFSGHCFILNKGNNLPGSIHISIIDPDLFGKHLYLYNEKKQSYEMLYSGLYSIDLELNNAGKYLLVNSKLQQGSFIPLLLTLGIIFVLIPATIYILYKKKYWFW
ncbi:Ig-like domain-containing protein [Ruminococcaceae bacterium OttesenSCG-928-A16]|nr:Ig-like domain-containing protein [Ruminococcaceae bacterium OttesenSCG-928-A16]